MRAETTLDLARARAILDVGHAAHAVVKERLLDYVAVRLASPAVPPPLLCLLGPPWGGQDVAGASGRVGARPPLPFSSSMRSTGRTRRAGVAAALLEAVDPPPGAAFRDRYQACSKSTPKPA